MTAEVIEQNGNRYALHEPLGEGAMGVVYRATDRLTGDMIALKRVQIVPKNLQFASRMSGTGNTNIRLALAQEFRTLASLRHPNIISVLDYGFDHNGQPFFTMELLENAQTVLEAGEDKPVEDRVALLIELLQALVYLHRRAILHRDLKPANVLVSQTGKVKVLDFGVATSLTQAEGVVGSLTYISPEVLRNQPASPGSDLFAVGIMAYQLLTGRYPFQARSPNHLMASILHQVPDYTAIENPALAEVVRTCLEKDAMVRYDDANTVIQALSAAIQQPPPQESIAIRESFLQTAPFIGREVELSQLENALDNAVHGKGSTWLIGGESGVGKSRLVDELRVQALVKGMRVLRGQGVEGAGLPYHLWREPLRMLALATNLSDLDAGVLKAIIPDIAVLLNRDVPETPHLEGQAQQQRLLATIGHMFQHQEQPVFLLLEDLQWMEESLEPLKQLNLLVSGLPLLIVANYRNDERPDLPEILPHMRTLTLKRFSRDETAQIAQAMIGEAGQQPAVLSLLQDETEGNVFFLVEVVRALAEEAGNLNAIGHDTLPEYIVTGGIQKIVQRRLSQIPERLQPLLKLAAVIGREIDPQLLLQVYRKEEVDNGLSTCANAAIVDIVDNRWRFAHDKLRKAMINSIRPKELPFLHRQAAQAIEVVYPDDNERAAVLTHHWHIAGQTEKELYYARLAGEQALSRSAFHTALDFIGRAKALLPDDSIEQMPLALQIAEVLFQLSQYDKACDQLEKGLLLAEKYADKASYATALNHLGAIARVRGDYVSATDFLETSLTLLHEVNDQPSIARVLLDLGWTDFRQGAFVKARAHFLESVTIYAAQGDQRGLAAALNRLGGAVLHLGNYEEAKALRIQSLELCQELGDRLGEARAFANLGEGERMQGNYQAARHYYLQALEIERAIDAQFLIGIVLINLGQVALACDNPDEAMVYFRESLQVVTAIGATILILNDLAGIAGGWAKSNQEERALELLGLVLAHPALSDETRTTAESILDDLYARYPADKIQAALEHGETLDLDTVVRELLQTFADSTPE